MKMKMKTWKSYIVIMCTLLEACKLKYLNGVTLRFHWDCVDNMGDAGSIYWNLSLQWFLWNKHPKFLWISWTFTRRTIMDSSVLLKKWRKRNLKSMISLLANAWNKSRFCKARFSNPRPPEHDVPQHSPTDHNRPVHYPTDYNRPLHPGYPWNSSTVGFI